PRRKALKSRMSRGEEGREHSATPFCHAAEWSRWRKLNPSSPLRRFSEHSAILPPTLVPSLGWAAAAQRGTAAPGCSLPSFRRNLRAGLRFWRGSYFHPAQQRNFKVAKRGLASSAAWASSLAP